MIRSELWRRGLTVPDIYARVARVSNARDALDGAGETDQDVGDAATANIVPTDTGGLVLGRTAPQVLNVVFQNRAAVTRGGFFLPATASGGRDRIGARDVPVVDPAEQDPCA